jgi:NTP pyrophosphatase (non-canonical NTP hydrolase)
MTTNGKSNNFNDIYNRQIEFQQLLLQKGVYNKQSMSLPKDSPDLSSYHIQQLISEVGEVLSADKRWKSYRNEHIDMSNKKEEIADCFIVLMNIALFSNMNADELFDTIVKKQNVNFERVNGEA